MTTSARIFRIAVFAAVCQIVNFFLSSQNYQIVKNPGLPFNINLPGFFDAYFVVLLLAIFVALYFFYFRQWTPGLELILGGAFSNLFDRFYFGYVRDYIDIGIGTMNAADIMIWIGIIYSICKSEARNSKSETNSNV